MRLFPSAVACLGYATLIFIFLIGVGLGPIGGQRHPVESAAMQTTRTLALAMFQYANDNNGQYPDGTSSTEVFQKLIDGNYLSDPAILYIRMWGKTKAEAGAKLRPENVCYDVTSGVDMNSPDFLPVVFVTGFRINYQADGSAVSLVRPFPKHHNAGDFPWSYQPFGGLAVAYKNNNAFFRNGQPGADGMGVVPHVVSADFNAHDKIYHQLTPEGPLK
jgi:hypothetical protein